MLTPKGTKERLFEIFQRVTPDFKQPQELQETPYQQYSDRDALMVEKKMIEEYGETYNPRAAGFITISGHMIDFSGGGYNTRGIDHKNVGYILDELGIDLGKYGGEDWKNSERVGMYAVMDMGIIRFIPESWGFNMHKMPTQEQFESLRDLLGQKNGRCILDLEDGEDKAHVEHDGETDVSFVLDGIKNFYRYGDKPRSYNDYDEDEDLMESYINNILYNKNEIINENHDINDFKLNKTKNIVQRYIDSGSIPTEFIEPNRYFIIGLDYMNGVISVSTTLSKETCSETIKYLKTNSSVQQIIIEKPNVAVQSMTRFDKWEPKNNIYGNENQLKIDLKEIQVVNLDSKRTIIF